MPGINARTLKPLAGWAHCAQSLETLVSTYVGERVHRRDIGFDGTAMQDRPMNEIEITAAMVAVAEAIEPRLVDGHQYGEPRFDLARIRIIRAGDDGRIDFELQGLYYPRGHLGDFSAFEPRAYAFPASIA